MAQRPQPSLRLADGGSFITRWAQSVMRPNATANRLREADAPPPPPAAPASAPVRAPAPPPPNPNATPDNPAGIRFQDGGHVPGTGRGDKIPAKYEPGEFVVSNDMIDDNPGLREQLSGLRAETLAARGKTVEEADAKALNGGRRPSLRAAEGFPGIDVDERPWRGSADSRLFARDPGPGNPNVGRTPPAVPAAPAAAPPAAAPGRLRAAFDGATGRNFVGPNRPMSAAAKAGVLGGAVLGAAVEAPGVAAVAGDADSTGVDVATQVAGAGGKLAAAGLGAKAGAALGAFGGPAAPVTVPLGAMLGGAAGYWGADKLIEGGRSLAGADTRDPAEQVAQRAAPPAATTLRTRPEDTFAGPPAAAAGAASPATDPGAPRRVDRPGQSPLFTNVADDAPYIGNNALMARGNGPNAQNMAAANNLVATDSLRSQGAALGGQSAGGSGMPAMPQTLHSGNDWASRKSLENLRTSASSIYDSRSRWGNKAKAAADANAYQNAQAMDAAKQAGADPGSVSRTKAGADMFGSKTAADASRYGSDNSLRGQMYSSDAQLGAKRMEMQQRLRQQQAIGGAFRDNKGDPVATARALASAGLTDAAKSFQDMAGADQARTQGNVKDARSTFENMFTRDGKNGPERDENGEALAHQLASQIVPGWENMSAEQRAANRTKVVEATRMVQGMNSLRNNGIGQRLGIDNQTPAYSQLPDMNGAVVGDVGWWDGMTTPGVSKGDKRITLRGGQERYLPQGSLTEAQLRILQENGARPQK